jgi:putative transcriptional regulator
MAKKLTGKVLAGFEATRDIWQEVLDGVREIKAGGGKRTNVGLVTDLWTSRMARGEKRLTAAFCDVGSPR